jgi:NAD(P)-dependent dehydrogenase (short-subunit alcohol dehydrogenase family)
MRSWAIVTGAGSGIGAALAHRLLRADVSVVRQTVMCLDFLGAAHTHSPPAPAAGCCPADLLCVAACVLI